MWILTLVLQTIQIAIGLCGIVGAVQVLTTREDAFSAADRHNKWVWFAMLLGSSFAAGMGFNILSFLAIIGTVIIGIYWFDVRPHIKDILGGGTNYGW